MSLLNRAVGSLALADTSEYKMADLKIYCSWCGEHAFRVDENTVHTVLILLKCPKCEKITTIGSEPGGNIIVVPGVPKSSSDDKVGE